MNNNRTIKDEQIRAARVFERWIMGNSLTGIWVRYWFSPKRVICLNTPVLKLPSKLSLSATDRLLDIGCGYGGVLIYLYRKIGFLDRVEGVDASSLMVKLANEEIRKRGFEGKIKVREGVATNLPYPDETFDVVLSTGVVKHLSDDSLLLVMKEVKRVLKRGGHFCFWEAGICKFKGLNKFNTSLLTRGFLSRGQGFSIMNLRSSDELRSMLRKAGFRNIEQFNHSFCLYYPVLPRVGFIGSK